MTSWGLGAATVDWTGTRIGWAWARAHEEFTTPSTWAEEVAGSRWAWQKSWAWAKKTTDLGWARVEHGGERLGWSDWFWVKMELSREREDGEDGLMLMICMYRNCKGNGMK
ncbi:hypothetical protein M0R45_025422 [Rubus argutus]|uniref:Uncharacterized protein n=1 Tax=Rubus argutus TaxID=59490 RepID=A0AAW1WY05_RUBAR